MHKDINVNVSGPVQPSSTYKTVVLKGNLPFASQVTEPNMKYVIKHDFDLGGGSVTIPEGCLLEFEGGSLSNGALILQDNTVIEGNGSVFKVNQKIENGTDYYTENTAFIIGNAKSVIIRNLILKGKYDESVGHINVWNGGEYNAKDWIYVSNSSDITFDGVVVNGFCSTKSNKNWNDIYHSNDGFFPVYIRNCDNINLLNCEEHNSDGEAWCIFWSTNVNIKNMNVLQKYGTSYLTVMYCDGVFVTDSVFKRTVTMFGGNLLNIYSRNYLLSNNYIEGGDVDYGNEHTNVILDEDIYSYDVYNCKITGNTIIDGRIINNTKVPAKPGAILPEYQFTNLLISDNQIIVNNIVDTVINAISAGNIGYFHDISVKNNNIEINGTLDPTLYERYRYQAIVMFLSTGYIDKADICSNKILYNYPQEIETLIPHSLHGEIVAREIKEFNIIKNELNGYGGINFTAPNSNGSDINIIGNKITSLDVKSISLHSSTSRLYFINNICKYTNAGTQIDAECETIYFENNIIVSDFTIAEKLISNKGRYNNNVFTIGYPLYKDINISEDRSLTRFYFAKNKYLELTFKDIRTYYRILITSGVKIMEGFLSFYNEGSALLSVTRVGLGKDSYDNGIKMYVSNNGTNRVVFYNAQNLDTHIYIEPVGEKISSISSSVKDSLPSGDDPEHPTVVLRKIQYNGLLYASGQSYRPEHVEIGSAMFDTSIGKNIYWNGSAWIDSKGFAAISAKGLTKPTGIGAGGKLDPSRDVGFMFYNTSAGMFKPIYAKAIANDGTVTWLDANGLDITVNKSGTWAVRPTTASKIYEGFMYMLNDNTNHFPIYAHINGSTIEWYKADGTQYTGS